jgi:hypothetical protein
MKHEAGTSLIDLLVSLGIIAVLFGGIYLVYFSIVTAIANIGVHTAATTAISNELEMIRNLPYSNVGTVGGIPSGVIPQVQSVSIGQFSFSLQTTVLNIEDPFDQSPSSTPVADYKLVDIVASCALCTHFSPVEITTTVASRNLTAGTPYGSIFVTIINSNGVGVPEATVQVVNASVTPSVDVTDVTNASGVLKLIGVSTSTQGYQIFASKNGFSSAQTYSPGGAGNPNPIQPNITVASETVSDVTLAIDALAVLNVSTTNDVCQPVASEPFSVQGTQLIGTSPDVYNFATTTKTNANGSFVFAGLPWDTYSLALADPAENVAGTVPFSPITIDPSSTQSFQFILQPASNPSLLVNVMDSGTGGGIPNANVTLSKSGVSQSLMTDHAALSQSDWSGTGSTGYASQSGGIDPTSTPGELTLLVNASGTYATGTTASLISNTFDLGGTSSTFNAISWNPAPASEPPLTQVEFQVAANNDNVTWNFIGPDGTAGTFFTSSSTLPASLNGNRYFRYEIFMNTQDPNATPNLSNVSLDFTANCVPPAQTLFTSLAQGNYTLDVTAPNYNEASTTLSVGSGFQSSTIELVHL